MAFSWNPILAPDETLQKEFSISPRYQKALLAVVVILAIAAIFVSWYASLFIAAVGGFYWWYIHTAKHYAFTSRRMVLVQTFLGQDVTSIDYNQITDIEIEQSTFDLMGKWGTIVVNTAGTHVPEVRLTFIDSPQLIKQALDEIRDMTTAVPQPAITQPQQTTPN